MNWLLDLMFNSVLTKNKKHMKSFEQNLIKLALFSFPQFTNEKCCLTKIHDIYIHFIFII